MCRGAGNLSMASIDWAEYAYYLYIEGRITIPLSVKLSFEL